ncbi:sensor domain-containing diguanylate cyclase [Terasakiella sp. SH-1]|uniref:sensor domain-containing diguanylate cyclase n=1 Tax=Terasakiella sp. SH-1 TaxID=2560057 RepID=UPI0010732284|nr:sensor domain-containing diguanylate cyclase [Terasakiella sp. SH-1]
MAETETVVQPEAFDLSQTGWAMRLVEKASNLFTVCVNDRIQYMNPAGRELLGAKSPIDVLGAELLNYIHEDYKEFLSFGLGVLAEEGDFIPLKLVTIDGRSLDVKLLINAVQIGTSEAFIVEVQDITAYKRASEAVQDREHRIKSILNTVSEGIITFDADGTIQTFNPAAETVFALTAKEAIGLHIEELMPKETRAKYRRIFERKISQGTSKMMGRPIEFEGYNRTKGEFPMEMTVSSTQVGSDRMFTAVLRDITERVQTVERIRHLAHHDTLTGLPNRHLFKDRLLHAIKLSKRYDKCLVLMFIDLDKFKPINDTLGHDAGDVVLIEVARRFKNIIRESDTVARIGGDEFVILLEELDTVESGPVVAQKVLDCLKEPIMASGQDCYLGASIGMACFPEDTMDAEVLMRYADEAMYAVKTSGRNGFKSYDSTLSVLGTK